MLFKGFNRIKLGVIGSFISFLNISWIISLFISQILIAQANVIIFGVQVSWINTLSNGYLLTLNVSQLLMCLVFNLENLRGCWKKSIMISWLRCFNLVYLRFLKFFLFRLLWNLTRRSRLCHLLDQIRVLLFILFILFEQCLLFIDWFGRWHNSFNICTHNPQASFSICFHAHLKLIFSK